MRVIALKSFTTADLKLSLGVGTTVEVEEEIAEKLIEDGLVAKHEELTPKGTINITKNSTVDVAQYKSAQIKVNLWTVTFNANNAQQEAVNIVAANGDNIQLHDGEGFTIPEGKQLSGWATTDDARNPDVVSPYTPTKDITLYAVWKDAEE